MRRSLPRGLLPWILWSIPAAFITVLSLHESAAPTWRVAIAESLPWYYWAAITPLIMRFARAHPAETLATRYGTLLHIGNGILCGAGCGVVATVSYVQLGMNTRGTPPAELLLRNVLFWAVFGLIFYALITAVAFVRASQERAREREVAASRLQAQLVEAQLHGLRMQLQPHFLFNTLNTVAMYVREGDADTSVRVLARLSELLRRVLDTGSEQEVTLGTELEYVERYLEIESVRFSDRLAVSLDVPADLRTALVPNLALQPLVENAVRHGIANRSERGTIALTATREADDLVIRITNTGPALAADWKMEDADGIGLRNTQRRLEHLYGERARLRLFNEAEGVVCEMRLPWHTQTND